MINLQSKKFALNAERVSYLSRTIKGLLVRTDESLQVRTRCLFLATPECLVVWVWYVTTPVLRVGVNCLVISSQCRSRNELSKERMGNAVFRVRQNRI